MDQLLALDDADTHRNDLINRVRDELIPHARAEEAVFYNSIRALDSAKMIVVHAFQEHIEAEGLLRTLQVRDKIDAEWKATARKLKDTLEHHIQEEENEIIPAAEKIFTKEEAEVMGEAFIKLKPEVKKEGFMQTTLELLVNMMPPGLAPKRGSINLDNRI
jgi:hemerythrin-like domain-containing protein